jgi:CRP/FNR family transcriptional regulator, cyclic AMP receptor protein
MDHEQTVEQLRTVPLFRDFSDEELGHVAQMTKRVEFPEGKTVANQGETGVGFHLIIEGSADVIQDGTTIGRLKPGDYFGEISLIDGGPRTATVTADTPVTIEVVERRDFDSLLERVPGLPHRIMLGLARRLREKTDRF